MMKDITFTPPFSRYTSPHPPLDLVLLGRWDMTSVDDQPVVTGICGVWERNGEGMAGGGRRRRRGVGHVRLFSSWSWGVKLCVDVCVSRPLIRGWDTTAPDPHGRIAGWVCSDPATLMPLILTTLTRRLMSHVELWRHAVCVCVCVLPASLAFYCGPIAAEYVVCLGMENNIRVTVVLHLLFLLDFFFTPAHKNKITSMKIALKNL